MSFIDEIAGHILSRNDERTAALETIIASVKRAYEDQHITEETYLITVEWLDKITKAT